MTLSALTVFAAAALGGAVAVDVTMLVVAAVVVLAVLGAINTLRVLGDLTRFLQN